LRKKGKQILWPAYFETSYSWGEGRRIPKKHAIRNVSSDEVFEAASGLGLNPVLNPGAAFSKKPWEKTGHVVVDKKTPKSVTIKEIASKIKVNRASR